MKKQIFIFTALSAILLLQACIPSIYPLYSSDTIATNPQLVGQWEAGEDQWIFSQTETDSYELAIRNKQEASSIAYFKVYLVQLEGTYFLDFYPTEIHESSLSSKFPDDFKAIHLVKAHTFARVNIQEGQLAIQLFDSEWIRDKLKERRIRIKHEQSGEQFVLTASTADLQKFILKYQSEKGLFSEAETLVKVR